MSTSANALYEEHKAVVSELQQAVKTAAGVATKAVGAPSASQCLKDCVTAYSMAIDKFLSFHSTLVRSDGTTGSTFGFVFTPESIDPT